ncbi:hypothetical protein, conserved [Eimeria maxima]|uniref:Uncharacterized protein n=1 Tax=Eimeria maxima TaxID=5804 RepID=U6M0C4_EIMMA|nr:hypothetical protein, conserved [Eimeria maxima]CDJ57466.1 hypothetical protein, conserved [Eimeria maxima]
MQLRNINASNTAMLPYPVEENIWLGGPRPACVASIPDHVNTAAAAAPPPPPGEAGGGADTPESPERDLARLLPYVQVQAAAAAGNISPRDQVALMQRLLLLLLPLLQGQGPSDTFLRCMFFKQPLPPILSAYKAGHWKSASPAAAAAAAAAASTASAAVATASAQGKADKDAAQTSGRPRGASAAVTQGRVTKSTRIATAATAAGSVPVFACADDDPPALALTSRLGLLRLFCAVYARLCIRLHALGCFGALEGLMFADEAEMSAVDTAWDMLVRLGPKPPQRRQQQGERLSQQELIDTREEEFAAWATDSWPLLRFAAASCS